MVADMVFRRLGSPADFARAWVLLRTEAPGDEWSGLWDLTAADSEALAAVAATRRVSSRVVEVRAVKSVRGYAAQARLVREIADAGRARGIEKLVAPAGCDDAEVLRRAGFRPEPGTGRLVLQL